MKEIEMLKEQKRNTVVLALVAILGILTSTGFALPLARAMWTAYP